MTGRRSSFLFLVVITLCFLSSISHAQVYMTANVQLPTPGSSDEPIIGTCQAVLLPYSSVDESVTAYEDYFYYGVYAPTCKLYMPNDEESSCIGNGSGGGSFLSSCTVTGSSSAESGEYELQGQTDLYNWYDNFAIYGSGSGWGECYDVDVPYDDPLDYAYYGGQNYPGVTTTPTYSGIGDVDFDCVNVSAFTDIEEISTPDYAWGGQMSIKLSPPTMTVNSNATQEFTATVTNGSGATVNWTLSSGTGTISPTSVAISGTPATTTTTYTAPSTVSGETFVTLTATAENSSGVEVSADANITVSDPIPMLSSISPSNDRDRWPSRRCPGTGI